MSVEETLLQEVKSGAKTAEQALEAMLAHCKEFASEPSQHFLAELGMSGTVQQEPEAPVQEVVPAVEETGKSGVGAFVEKVVDLFRAEPAVEGSVTVEPEADAPEVVEPVVEAPVASDVVLEPASKEPVALDTLADFEI